MTMISIEVHEWPDHWAPALSGGGGFGTSTPSYNSSAVSVEPAMGGGGGGLCHIFSYFIYIFSYVCETKT